MKKLTLRIILGIALAGVLVVSVYSLPPVRARIDWRLAALQAEIKYALSPPEEVVFIPQQQSSTAVTPTNPGLLPASPTPLAAVTSQPEPSGTPPPSPTPAQTSTPLPGSFQLSGVLHEFQTWNNCGPANLAMTLSFWGWQGDQRTTAEFLKPNPRDKNVMPYEMARFVETRTDFKVLVRAGGSLELVRQLVAAGIPVILEKGFEGPNFEGWMGHYVTVTGYDDTLQQLTTQDSFLGPDVEVNYQTIEAFWRSFNFTFILIYPPEREEAVLDILATNADGTANLQSALQIASEEIYTLSGRDQFFAWFNRGTSLVGLQDYAGAAYAFDEAFAIYAGLPEDIRPWRTMWYQTGPYWAYYYTGRYEDVIGLATTTLDSMSEPVLEESYYWMALAREALGDTSGAIADLQTSLEVHPGFEPSTFQLERLTAGD